MHTGIPIDGKTVFTSDHALKLEWLPQWVAIIGSGYIGLEFSDVYTALGTEVTFIEVGVPAALCVCVVCVRMFFMCVLRVGGRGQASWFLILISRSLPLLQPQCSPSVCARICTYTCTHARSPASTCTKG